jgi:hypothetical protein
MQQTKTPLLLSTTTTTTKDWAMNHLHKDLKELITLLQ